MRSVRGVRVEGTGEIPREPLLLELVRERRSVHLALLRLHPSKVLGSPPGRCCPWTSTRRRGSCPCPTRVRSRGSSGLSPRSSGPSPAWRTTATASCGGLLDVCVACRGRLRLRVSRLGGGVAQGVDELLPDAPDVVDVEEFSVGIVAEHAGQRLVVHADELESLRLALRRGVLRVLCPVVRSIDGG